VEGGTTFVDDFWKNYRPREKSSSRLNQNELESWDFLQHRNRCPRELRGERSDLRGQAEPLRQGERHEQ
jgi:hypothetical protein